MSSAEACKRKKAIKHEHVCKDERTRRIDQDMDQPTCELSGEGLRRLKVFLAATFLTIVLVLVGTRGAADCEVTSFLEADCGVIGCFCIMTFFRGGEFLQKRTTGAGGKNSKGEPSLCVGSGPSCCCKEKEWVSKRVICKLHQENLRVVVPVPRGCHSQRRAVSAMVPEPS